MTCKIQKSKVKMDDLFEDYFPMKHESYRDAMMSSLSDTDMKKWEMVKHHASVLASKGVCVRYVPLYFDDENDVWWSDYVTAYVEYIEPPVAGECLQEGDYYPYLFFEIKMDSEQDSIIQFDSRPAIQAYHMHTEQTKEAFSVFLQNTYPIVQWDGDERHTFEIDIGDFDHEEWNKIKNE